jgi:ABC-2 type transport system ATP-binding protein
MAYNHLRNGIHRLRDNQMSEATIEVTGLRKRFGPALALDGMSFTVWPGAVTGFVGPNGAGKTNIGI